MIKKNEIKVKVGSVWNTSEMIFFKVFKLEENYGKITVFYKQINNGKEYSCFKEAFLERFFVFNNSVSNILK